MGFRAKGDVEVDYRELCSSPGAIVWEADAATWGFSSVSWGAKSILGYSIQQWLSDRNFWLDHVYFADRSYAARVRKEATARGDGHRSEYRATTADGRIVWLLDIVRFVKAPCGEADRLCGITVDITDQKRAEGGLHRSEQYYHELFETNPASILVCTLDGRLVGCNPAAARMFGYDSASKLLAEAHWPRLGNHSDWKRLSGEINRDSDCGALEVRLQRRDGQPIWVLASMRRSRYLADQPDLILTTMIDITERKSAELRLRRMSERIVTLEEEDRRRIATEIRDSTAQGLAALTMNLAVIEQSNCTVEEKPRTALRECLALAEGCAQELRTYSALLYPPMLDEFGLVSALRSYLQGLRKRTGLHLSLAVDASLRRYRLPKEVETTLFRVVQEALANVHLHSGSKTAEIKLTRHRRCGKIVLRIQDQGHGVPGRILRALEKDATGNSGLGIPRMTERVKRLGGHFRIVTSKHGTVLVAALPLPPESNQACARELRAQDIP